MRLFVFRSVWLYFVVDVFYFWSYFYYFSSPDAPYLSPDKSIRRNEPQFLPLVVRKVAQVYGVEEEVIVRETTRTCEELFGVWI